ncbi:hypothetical protein ATZ33_12170 [Enterococcus silesiacus]|uniref:Signal peptidase I n=2 Tax=Enterococcus silesiacus TaxID=332949 RepID=A0ABM5WAZ4_9ENTE|nr:hypothetical protein ATZ33_12170 [Enterococcus silesiacus]
MNKKKTIPSTKKRPKKRKRSTTASIHKRSNEKNIKKVKRKRQSQQKRKKRRTRKRVQRFLIELGITTAISLLLLSFFRLVIFTVPRVGGYSMTMALNEGDRLFVNKLAPIKRYDLIYFIHPFTKEKVIQRVIGLQGESLYYQNDQLFIDGEMKNERFLATSITQAAKEDHLYTNDFTLLEKTGKSMVPKDSYFVMVDNRMYETDSREFGFIQVSDVIGVVKLKWFPLHQMQKF